MYEMQLNWKSFNVDMNSVETWLKENAGDKYKGNSADVCLHLWFSEEPAKRIQNKIKKYWGELDNKSDEAKSYKSQETVAEEKKALKESAKEKLRTILTDEEIKALLG